MKLKTREEVAKIREAGKILAQVAKAILAHAKEGVRLGDLDKMARKLINERGGEPAFLGYKPYGATRPYPASICTSLNDAVVHGVPDNRILKSGDVLKLDFGVRYQGWHADAAWTIGIGKIPSEAQKLIKVTEKSLFDGIKQMRPGRFLGDIGWAISKTVERHGFKVIEGLTGHGIGLQLHEDPSVFNEGKKGSGMPLRPGMILAVEPMVSAGSPRIVQTKDEGYATEDGSMSAHFEHTIAITENGPEILTLI